MMKMLTRSSSDPTLYDEISQVSTSDPGTITTQQVAEKVIPESQERQVLGTLVCAHIFAAHNG